MQTAIAAIDRFHNREDGQDLIEYAMLMALIAIFAMGAVQAVGNTIDSVFWRVIAAASV